MGFRIIEHTADIGVEVEASGLSELFECSAAAMMSIIANGDAAREKARPISLKAGDVEALMYAWLNEIIFIVFSERFLPVEFNVGNISRTGLEAEIWGEEIQPGDRRLEMEIKGATFNDMVVEGDGGSWRARVIFDV